MTTDNEIYTQLDRITDHLATMTKQERIAWFRRSTYVQPLNFIREIDGTVYAVRALKFTAGYVKISTPTNSIISGCGKENYDKTTG